ncbi:ACT domain-containing protein [Limnobaculum zhutongyuii]|uniref:ACT domain-containing protein n=1 Tax=Limnobaculum zhutongyuii TaxID=2498113 RepID=A0A411WM27_9GAMM|nr:ACT domain-containing protein [Limnobaculum zhutongyuii]QBH97264.1 ACT domain-containing protein [Limnobaculum zhutongyuii]TQS88523.1 ACT domain-containing protein [Limnobaculum zhutongyuii]
MQPIKQLSTLLSSMSPALSSETYVFCTIKEEFTEQLFRFKPKGLFVEEEGVTLIITQQTAITHQLAFSGTFRQITLTVHSSLEAVGLTAAVSKALADNNISANVVAAYYHDHIFVPEQDADRALNTLIELQKHHARLN